MDTRKIADILRATIDPSQQQQAEEQLSQVLNPRGCPLLNYLSYSGEMISLLYRQLFLELFTRFTKSLDLLLLSCKLSCQLMLTCPFDKQVGRIGLMIFEWIMNRQYYYSNRCHLLEKYGHKELARTGTRTRPASVIQHSWAGSCDDKRCYYWCSCSCAWTCSVSFSSFVNFLQSHSLILLTLSNF